MIKLRKENPVLVYGSYELILENHEKVYAYTRIDGDEKMLIIANLFAEETEITVPAFVENSELLLNNYQVDEAESASEWTLKPFEARVYKVK